MAFKSVKHIRTGKIFRLTGHTENGCCILTFGKLFCIAKPFEIEHIKPRLTAKDFIFLREMKISI